MRDWTGGPWRQVKDPQAREFCYAVDYFLRDLSRGVSRIQKGEVPDGSGSPLPGSVSIPDEPGAVLFIGPGPILDTDLGNFFWDDTNNRLGIGTSSPDARLNLDQSLAVDLKPTTTVSGYDTADAPWASSTFGDGGAGSSPNIASDVDEGFPSDDATTFIRSHGSPTADHSRCVLGINGTIPAGAGTYTITYRAMKDNNDTTDTTYFFQLYRSDGNGEVSASLNVSALTTSFATYTTDITITGSPSLSGGTANSLGIRHNTGGSGNPARRILISAITITAGGGSGTNFIQWDVNGIQAGRVTQEGYVETPRLQLTGSTSGTLSLLPAAATTDHSLTWPGAQGAANTFLLNNGSGTLSWSTLGAVGGDFVDSLFRIVGSSDATKKLAFEVDGFTSGQTRTLTPQNTSYIVAGINVVAQTFTTDQVIAPTSTTVVPLILKTPAGSAQNIFEAYLDTIKVFHIGGDGVAQYASPPTWWNGGVVGSGNSVVLNLGSITQNVDITVPDFGTMTLTGLTSTQTMSNKTINTSTIGASTELNSSTITSGVAFQDVTTTTKQMRVILSSAAASTNTALAFTTTVTGRTFTFLDTSGNVLTDAGTMVDDNGDVVTLDGEVVAA